MKTFWKEWFHRYCDFTHLHGFKEFRLSKYRIEKLIWIFILLGAFVFTAYLIYKSVQDSLDEKKQTVMTYEKYGNIFLPIMYCPNSWIKMPDVEGMMDEGPTKRREALNATYFGWYALSFLRTNERRYLDESMFEQYYRINVKPEAFCENKKYNSYNDFPQLIILAPFIQYTCLQGEPLPNYFGRHSKRLIFQFGNQITKTIAIVNFRIMNRVFDACVKGNATKVYEIIYKEAHLSTSTLTTLKWMFKENETIIDVISRCRLRWNEYTIFFTLEKLDKLEQEFPAECELVEGVKANDRSKINEFENYHKTDEPATQDMFCDVYNSIIMFYMFNNQAHRFFICSTCIQMLKIEERRSILIANILTKDTRYLNYLKKSSQNNSLETFKNYIFKEISGKPINRNREIVRIRQWSEEVFYQEEKKGFYDYLQANHMTVLDLLKRISFSEKDFLLGMSVDPVYEIRPRNGTIAVQKVINARGVCYSFEIKADMRPTTDMPIIINDVKRRRRINEKLYVNIVPLMYGSISLLNDESILMYGSESDDLMPNKNSFKVKESRSWEDSYYSFDISNLAYMRDIENCRERDKNGYNITYTYNNCLTNCYNIYVQPKNIMKAGYEKAFCEYITESTSILNISKQCSYFIDSTPFDPYLRIPNVDYQRDLDLCNAKCVKECEVIKFDITKSKRSCDVENDCIFYERFPKVRSYADQFSFSIERFEWYDGDGPKWMKPFASIDDPTIPDMISHAGAGLRMEFQIDSVVINYTTTRSLEWYSYLGVVGGQINLIISGSCLTLFQLIWWFSRYIYDHFNKSNSRRGTISHQTTGI